MHVSDVRIHLYSQPNSGIKAFAEVQLDSVLVLRNFAVHTAKDKLEVRFPDKVLASGKRQDQVYAVTVELYNEIVFAVLDAYKKEVALTRVG